MNYVIRKFRESLGLFEVNEGVWTMRASTRGKGKRGISWLLKLAASLGLLLALLLPGSAAAKPGYDAGPVGAPTEEQCAAGIETPWRFEVICGFIGTGTEGDPNRPNVADDYELQKWEDVTGTPSAHISPDPNLYAIQAEGTEAVLDAIEADNDYLVVWSEEIIEEGAAPQFIVFGKAKGKGRDGKPPANEFGKIRSYLARNRPSYMAPPEWNAAIKAVIKEQGDLTRGEIAQALRELMKEFPKAE